MLDDKPLRHCYNHSSTDVSKGEVAMAKSPIQMGLPFDVGEPAASTRQPHDKRPTMIGRSSVAYIPSKTILTESSGFMSEYDYTLNPYSGCTFGCTYCYAAFFVRDQAKQDSWGQWVHVKENALVLLRRKRNDPLDGKRIYMSSVTDPYQPIERNLELTRSILEELITYHQPRLVIQTRSPFVVRDIDLLQRFSTVQVNMTITTDDEQVRKVFEPTCSSIKARFEAITHIQQAGIPACITMTPLLPVTDPEAFAQRLLATGIQKFIIQPFHPDRGKFVAGTRDEAKRLFRERNWTLAAYHQVLAIIKQYIPNIGEGKEGFAPI
jgi:DNA repair photolyase